MALKEVVVEGRSYKIGYEIINPQAEHDIVFLHGWGSQKEIMAQAFKNHLKEFRHIYIDLPGFGKSTIDRALETSEYAKIIDTFCATLPVKKQIVIGHSFGGKVAILLKPDLLVLLSSAGILWPKPLKVRAKIALYKMLKPFGKRLRHFFVSDDAKGMNEVMYETFKRVVDEDFAPIFATYDKAALLVWGREDRATPLKSAKRINELIKGSRLEVLEGDHYFFLDKGAIIEKLIKEEYEKLQMHR